MTESSFLNQNFVLLVLLLIFGVLAVIVLSVLAYRQRKQSFELFITNKNEFLKKINLCFFKMGFHLESEKEDLIVYKNYFTRIGITFNQNKAILIGPGLAVEHLLDVYSGKKKV